MSLLWHFGCDCSSHKGRCQRFEWIRDIHLQDVKMDAAELSDMSVAIRKPERFHNPDDNLDNPLVL
jgi:hypothetical protein